MTDPPDELIERLRAMLSEERLDRWRAAWEAPLATTLRINPLRGDPDETRGELTRLGIDSLPVAWCPEAVIAPPEARTILLTSELWQQGRIHLQSLPSIAATVALDPRPGERILDLCAAPGSKTSHIAARIGALRDDGPRPDPAPLTANDRSQNRAQRLRRVLEQLGASARIIIGPGERPGLAPPGTFDRVLVDAPCSGEGRIPGSDDADQDDRPFVSSKLLRRMASAQKQLLHAAIRLTRPGGRIVYSTCALSREENEEVLARALERYAQFIELEPLDFDPTDALPAAEGAAPATHICRIVPAPHDTPMGRVRLTEGFCLARLRRTALPFSQTD